MVSSGKSSSSQSQESLTFSDSGQRGTSAGGVAFDLSNLAVTRRGQITINYEPVNDPLQMAAIVGQAVGGVNDLAAAVQTSAAQTQSALASLAGVATGTQTEIGQLIGRLTTPLLIVGAVLAAIMLWRK